MEVTGVALGVVALLGIFKDCIDLFSTISAAKSLGRDYELLNTKLDIEKTLLLQWAERVRLLQPNNYDSRFDDPVVNKAVASILAAVQRLLSDSTTLQQKYSLERVDARAEVVPTMSVTRMDQFLREFEKLNLRIHTTQIQSSTKQRFFWVVKDRERFSGLIQELSNFVSKLNNVMPLLHPKATVDYMIASDLKAILPIRRLQLILDAARDHESPIADLAERAITERCQESILRRLWFRKVDDRRNNIRDAHYRTLHWALNPPQYGVEWDDLSQWLREGSDVYWISGKAGSGKSTLMKYLYGHRQTTSLLRAWAGERRLVIAGFFFWGFGTPEQKTLEGLSRGLLYQVLNADRSLIPQLLPDMWREAHYVDEVALEFPSDSEMETAFSTLRDKVVKDRFFFLIDGLDEYSGNVLDGVRFLNSLVSNGNIKVLVSSRPIPACFQYFSSKKGLRLQDLTRDDIRDYIDDVIGRHPHTQGLNAIDPNIVQGILKDLTEKASGVFLWVVLACRSLLEGFAAFDYPAELRKRVDELPPELESLFKHMLGKVEPRYRQEAARLLRVCFQQQLRASQPLEESGYHLPPGVYTLGLALVDEYELDLARIPPPRLLSRSERRMKCKMLEGRLRSRSCSLLEVRLPIKEPDHCFCEHESEQHANGIRSRGTPDKLVDSVVEFMHRSVFDFLSGPGVWDLECLRLGNTNFDADIMLSTINLHLLYVASGSVCLRPKQLDDLAGKCLIYMRHADMSFGEATIAGLLRFSSVVLEVSRSPMPFILPSKEKQKYEFFEVIADSFQPSKEAEAQLAFLIAVELGMINTVRNWEGNWISNCSRSGPVLFHALRAPFTGWLHTLRFKASCDMVRYLLDSGCDPNEALAKDPFCQTTPWITLIESQCLYGDFDFTSTDVEITRLFLEAGAVVDMLEGDPGFEGFRQLVESLVRIRRQDGNAISEGSTRAQRVSRSQCDAALKLLESRNSPRNGRQNSPKQGLLSKILTAMVSK